MAFLGQFRAGLLSHTKNLRKNYSILKHLSEPWDILSSWGNMEITAKIFHGITLYNILKKLILTGPTGHLMVSNVSNRLMKLMEYSPMTSQVQDIQVCWKI